ncbi:MAG: DUF1294 domain-containing protein [Oscillospiraceae bacterium]|nr:DUF1294 domain-containing protein [Oscillospiraceae bacterium]
MDKYILPALLVTNLAAFMAFGIDKLKARKDRWRIPEKTLLMMGLCFGGIGQLVGMRVFRHKTKKWYFVVSGVVFSIIQIAILVLYYTKWKIM